MIKRLNIGLICLLIGSIVVQIRAAELGDISYRIQFDSKEKEEVLVVEHMLQTYQRVTKSVKRKSASVMILQHLDEFKLNDDDTVTFEQGVVCVVMGDGKGSVIEGDFISVECGTKIETASWILEQLGW